MTRLARTLALSVCVLSLLLGSAKNVEALLLDSYKSNTYINKNVTKTLEAVDNSETSGIPSLNSLVDETSFSWQTSLYLNVAGVPEEALVGMTEEQKRIFSERYGRGMIGEVGQGIVALYTPPASSQTYLADLLESAHIIPQAQAQGLGFASLNPILETWKVFRNVAYLFFVVIFLVIGFMIMFRQKIGGQSVVTAQQAIPGIIISLIFVTFSYAIAGFLIDLMYLLMYLMVGLFRPESGTELLSSNIFSFGAELITGGGGPSPFTTVNNAVQELVKAVSDNIVGDALGWIAGITLGLVISIAVLIGVFKIFFELLKTYIAIIIGITTAPLTLMFGALPGQANFAKWVKTIVGNLLAFPVVLMALIFYKMFTEHDLSAGGFVPPYLLGRGQGSVILTLVGIGIILVIPELIKEVKKLFGAEGGIFDTLSNAALAQAREGAPLGAKAVGLVGGAGVGGLIGAGRGIWNTRNAPDWRTRLGMIAQFTGRGAGNAMATGTRVGGAVSTFVGGKTPSQLQFAEQAVDTAGGWMSDEARLKRISERKNILGRGVGENALYKERLKIAENQALKSIQEEERLKKGLYGQLISAGKEEVKP